jgi:hypothetical protein
LCREFPGRVFPVLPAGEHRSDWALEVWRTYDEPVFDRIGGGALSFQDVEIPFAIQVKRSVHSVLASLPGETLDVWERVRLQARSEETAAWPERFEAPFPVDGEACGLLLNRGQAIELSFEREAKASPIWEEFCRAMEGGLLAKDEQRPFLILAAGGRVLLRGLATMEDLHRYLEEVPDPDGVLSAAGLGSGRCLLKYRVAVEASRVHRAAEIAEEDAQNLDAYLDEADRWYRVGKCKVASGEPSERGQELLRAYNKKHHHLLPEDFPPPRR